MKYLGPPLLWVLLATLGCSGSAAGNTEEETTTKMHVIYPEIPLCDKQFIAGDTTVWQNFQIKNAYHVNMTISKIELRGNSTCSFKIYREPRFGEVGMFLCPEESADNSLLNLIIPYGGTTLLRVEYTPSQEGVMDYATIVITSNTSEVFTNSVAPMENNVNLQTGEISEEETDISRVLIPLCGKAISPAPDGGIDETDTDYINNPGLCPAKGPMSLNPEVCDLPLSQGAPGCQ